jgi:O-antigen/teichoic acid export membrane protein
MTAIGPGRWRRRVELARRLLATATLARVRQVATGVALSKALTLLALARAARVLGPESWGLAGSATAAVAYASVLLSPGLTLWGSREIARDRAALSRTLLAVNGAQCALACLAFAALAALITAFVADHTVRAVVAVSASALFLQGLSAEWVFDGLGRAHIPARLQAAASALRLAAVVALCRSPSDVILYAALLPACLAVQTAAGYYLLWREVHSGWSLPKRAELRRALRSATPLGLSLAVFLLAHNANTLIVQRWLGSRAAGDYLAALRLVEMASVLPGIASTVFRQRLARLRALDAHAAHAEVRLYARLHALAGALLAAFVFSQAPLLIEWLYGEQYTGAVPLLRVFAVAILANYLACGSTHSLIALGHDRAMLRSMAVSGAVSVLAGVLLIPRWGTLGAATAATLIHPVGLLAAWPSYKQAVGSLRSKHHFSTRR